ncbi:MAG: efflux RND transporter periplasmic adaptor subunit [Congregibacter sp.]
MKALVAVVAAVAGAFFMWQQFGQDGDAQAGYSRPAAPVTVVTVGTQQYENRIQALGTLQAWESVNITAPVSQLVTELAFEDGDTVEKGQVLARLRQDAQLAQEQELNARLADAKREVRRLSDLAKKNQVAQTDLDSAITAVEVFEHQLNVVRAEIADRTIVAPFAGVLGLREVSDGALVETGQRLTTLDDISRMRLQFTVPAKYLGVLRPGMAVSASTPAFTSEFEGVLTAVGSRVDPVARAVSARAVIPNDEGLLRPGLLMEIELRGQTREVVVVPEESLQSRAARHFVWVLDGEQAKRREVTIGDRLPGWVVVESGVSPGEQIVRDGVVRLSGNAMPVRVVSS